MYSACGDGTVYVWDVIAEKLISKITSKSPDHMCLSVAVAHNVIFIGKDDGLLHLYDCDSHAFMKSFSPFLGPDVAVPQHKRSLSYVSSIAIDSTQMWMLVGGGPQAYAVLYCLPSLSITAVLPTSAPINNACFTPDGIVTVGNEKSVHVWERNGVLRNKIETQLDVIYGVAADSRLDDQYGCIVSGLALSVKNDVRACVVANGSVIFDWKLA